MATICECGLAKCYHEGDNPLAYRPMSRSGHLPCPGYSPRGLTPISLNFTAIKDELEAKGFMQLEIPYRDWFLRISPRPWWASLWPFYRRLIEIVVVGHLVWFYEKKEAGWKAKLESKCWGRDQLSFERVLKTL